MTTQTSKKGIDLSVMHYHPWPTSFTGAVAKLLDDAHIHNIMWGDLLYWWRGNPHIPQICGFIVPSEQLEAAVAVVEQAGFSSCDCKKSLHFADPTESTCLPKHFRVAQPFGLYMTLFLCPSDRLLNLIPLDSSHHNPVALRYDLFALHLYDRRPVIRSSPGTDPEIPADYYVVKVLAPSSLVEVLIVLSAFSSPFDGVGRRFTDLLRLFALTSKNEPYVLQSPSLQRLWDLHYVRMKPLTAHQRKVLWDNIRSEWRKKLSF
ncbi:hypothetical protein H2248_002747 [Termitomyces sp. 'cryptogamus']|nr:hypothetical protein H2248_002747 [Termitomyces sp. 'cryptogamus']